MLVIVGRRVITASPHCGASEIQHLATAMQKRKRRHSSQAHRVHTAEEISCAFSSCLPGLQHISRPLIPFVSKNGKSTRALRPVLKNVSVVRSVDSGRKGNDTLCDDARSKMRSVVAKKLKKSMLVQEGLVSPREKPQSSKPLRDPSNASFAALQIEEAPCLWRLALWHSGPRRYGGQAFSSSQLRHYQTI